MIYCFYGTDEKKTRHEAHALIDASQKKKPDASFFHLTSENWSVYQFEELLQSAGLFERKYIVLLDGLLADTEIRKTISSHLKTMGAVDHFFVIVDKKIDKATLTKIEKYGQKTRVYSGIATTKETKDFALAHAVGRRSKKEAWVLLQTSLLGGANPDMVHGMLFWKIKDMMLKSQTSPYSNKELKVLLTRLLHIQYQARTGQTDMAISLEKFVLSL